MSRYQTHEQSTKMGHWQSVKSSSIISNSKDKTKQRMSQVFEE